jgi:hypothetical protein
MEKGKDSQVMICNYVCSSFKRHRFISFLEENCLAMYFWLELC